MQYPRNELWDGISQHSLMPAMFQHRLWLTSMFENMGDETSAQLIVGGDDRPGAVAGLTKQSVLKGKLPIIVETWDTGFLLSGTPLISRDDPELALTQLLQTAQSQMGARAVLFRKVQKTAEFEQILSQLADKQIAGHVVFNAHERAALDCSTNFDDWFTNNFSRKRRKEYRRVRNRLAEQGELVSTSWQQTGPIEPWIDEFLELESSGWKGRAGTAIACQSGQTAHLRQALRQMAHNGSLLFWNITLDGKVIASMFGFVDKNQAWLGKMAFDETLSQYSPGVLIILDATKNMFARDDIFLVDSGAEPNHPMINNIWRDRLALCDYLIATPSTSSVGFLVIVGFEKSRLKARGMVKTAYKNVKRMLRHENH